MLRFLKLIIAKYQAALELGIPYRKCEFIETKDAIGRTVIRAFHKDKGYSSSYVVE